jgi:hypothetical protein
MSNLQDSNVVHIDFQDRKALKKRKGTQTFHVVKPSKEGFDEWPEDLSPRERREQLKRDLDFLRQMSDIPPSTKKY